MRTAILFSTALLLTLPGCFGAEALQQASSGFTGCSADEITVSNDTPGFNQRSWDASCRGRTFHCSVVGKGGMSCVEDRAAASADRPAQSEAPRREGHASIHVWQRFLAKDCAVAVDLPGEPEERRATARAGSRPGTYSATVEVDGGLVGVECQPRAKSSDDDHALDAARDEVLRGIGATFASEFDLDGLGYHGRETQFVVGGEHGRMRVLQRNGQLVTLILAPTRTFSKQEASRFFQSLADAPAGASVATASAP